VVSWLANVDRAHPSQVWDLTITIAVPYRHGLLFCLSLAYPLLSMYTETQPLRGAVDGNSHYTSHYNHSSSVHSLLTYSCTPLPLLELHVREALTMLDEDGDGTLTEHDLRCAFIYLLGYTPSKLEVRSLMERESAREKGKSANERAKDGVVGSDVGGGGVGLSMERGIDLLCQRLTRQHPTEFFQQLFTAIDTHNRGFLVCEDFVRLCRHFAPALDVSVLNSLFSVVDVDGNGKVSYREFEAVMSGRKITHSQPH